MRSAPVLLLLILAALAAHVAGLGNGFVYDDHRFVSENTSLSRVDARAALLDPSTHTADRDRDVYRPLRVLGHAFDLRRWGRDPFGFHLHSLLAHVLNVILAWLLLMRLLPERPEAALLGATVLAVHPLGTEAVGWISSRGDLYAVTFGLAGLWLACRGGAIALALAGLAAALAVWGKESALVLPAVAWLARRALGRGARWGPLALALGAALALGVRHLALSGLTPVQTGPHGGDLVTQAGWALYGATRTLGHLLAPVGLSVDYPQDEWAMGPSVWLRVPTWLGAALAALPFWLWKRNPPAAFLAAWAALAYLPSSSLLVTLRSLVNDRAAYPLLLPTGALLGLALSARPRLAQAVALALALALIPLTVQRTEVFRSDTSLWTDALASHPGSVRAYMGLAAAAVDPAQAGANLRQAVRLAPSGSKLHAVALARLGDHVLRAEDDPAAAVDLLHHAWAATRHWSDVERPLVDEPATAASLAEALTRLREYAAAEDVLDQAIAREQDPLPLLIKRAVLRQQRAEQENDPGARSAALSAVQAAESMAPDSPLVAALRAWMQTRVIEPASGSSRP